MRKSRRLALSCRAFIIISILTSSCVRANAASPPNAVAVADGSSSRDDIQKPQGESKSPQPDEERRGTYESDWGEILDSGRELHLKGNVRITTKDAEFTCDEAVYDIEKDSLRALGNVRMTRDGSVFTADEATYDIRSETGELLNCRGAFDPWFFRAPRLERIGPNTDEIEGGYLTTCDLDPPHYRISAKKIELTDKERLSAQDVTAYLGPVPVMRIPRYTHSFGEKAAPFGIDGGHDSRLGYFVRTEYNLDLTEQFSGTAHGDLYSDEGFGAGLDGSLTPLEGGEATFRTYMTTKEKGRAELYYTQEMPRDWRAMFQLEQWSEEDFLEQFYYDEYRRRTEPETFLNLTRTRPHNIISTTLRKRTNGFVEETERLPEISVAFLERQIGTTPFYYAVENSAGYIVDRPGEESALRNFTGGRLSYAGRPTSWLSVVPFVDVEGTYYSKGAEEDEEDLYRTSFLSGVTLGTRLHRVYGSPLENFSAFKHIVVPTLTYTYRPTPDIRKREVHEFDAIDDVLGRSRIGFQLD
ncbi:MAG: LPS export ABC transporter periplasmic protein LptC, partial [Candidatus Hydrogenedentes bacterium]|nr:LPS export ABC transporter periplasmic protein LptC [Candidatus Hydrogenedentota bacterium]